jgi:hypothetical protein
MLHGAGRIGLGLAGGGKYSGSGLIHLVGGTGGLTPGARCVLFSLGQCMLLLQLLVLFCFGKRVLRRV